jgi:hypothetical protein
MSDAEPSYIDYEAFLDPSFSPSNFANSLVTATNNPSDTPLDLSTPLSRVLFDVQEIDTHIHTLTTKSAIPLLEHTKDQTDASQRILKVVEAQVEVLTKGYQRLEKEVLQRWETAEQYRLATERSWQAIKIGKAIARCLALGRQLETQMAEMGGRGIREDHRAMIRASFTLLMLKPLLSASGEEQEGYGLDRVKVVKTLRADLITPSENHVRARASQIVREFSMSSLSSTTSTTTGSQPSTSTFAQTEDAKSRATSAVIVLYLLSPMSNATNSADFQPELLLSALQNYLQTALTSSLASLSRALSTLPTLERTLLEVSARCQNIVALEALLESIKPPPHPLLRGESNGDEGVDVRTGQEVETSTNPASSSNNQNLLQPLLQSLDTSSLPSYFWRSLASSLSSRVQEILSRGGVSARTLRSNKERVKEELRGCVLRGSQLPVSSLSKGRATTVGNWEREAAVMVGSVIGVLGR